MDRLDFFCGKGETLNGPMPLEALERKVVSLLDEKRISHVLGCRDTAVMLAERWGADVVMAARAALLHDITKALNHEEQLTLCARYGIMTDADWQPKTIHALTGGIVAERIFKESEQIVTAVCRHTTGQVGMSLLDKIIYIADYIEPTRDMPGVEELRRLAFENLDAAVILGLELTLEHLKQKGSVVSTRSAQTLNWLRGCAKVII